GKASQANACRAGDGIGHSRRQAHEWCFARTHGRLVFAVDDFHFNLRGIAEARHAIVMEALVGNTAILEVDGLEHRTADALNNGSGDLVAQPVRIDHSATIKGLHDSHDPALSASAINGNLGTGGEVASLLVSTGDAEAAGGAGSLFTPAKTLRRGFKSGTQA